MAAVTSDVIRIANARSGEGFVAVSADARRKFWLDRARTAAIARHTNAFKINEDVVIPLPRMGEYTDAIERLNIEMSIRNKLRLVAELSEYLRGPLQFAKTDDAALDGAPQDDDLEERLHEARACIARAGDRWQWLLDNIDLTLDRKSVV